MISVTAARQLRQSRSRSVMPALAVMGPAVEPNIRDSLPDVVVSYAIHVHSKGPSMRTNQFIRAQIA